MENHMNIYMKLQTARVKIQQMNLKKSGKNVFAKFDYYDLSDILPTINLVFSELKLFSNVSFTDDLATLTIINAEEPSETIVFTSPTVEIEMKGANNAQALGSVITYLKRYLYINALEIVEHDSLDSTLGKDKEEKTQKPAQNSDKLASANQVSMIQAKIQNIAKKTNVQADELHKKMNLPDLKTLTSSQASAIIKKLIEIEGK